MTINVLGFGLPMTFNEIEVVNDISAQLARGVPFDRAVANTEAKWRDDMCHRNDGGEDGASGQTASIGTGDWAG